jgi:hypothetical protein
MYTIFTCFLILWWFTPPSLSSLITCPSPNTLKLIHSKQLESNVLLWKWTTIDFFSNIYFEGLTQANEIICKRIGKGRRETQETQSQRGGNFSVVNVRKNATHKESSWEKSHVHRAKFNGRPKLPGWPGKRWRSPESGWAVAFIGGGG